MSENESALPANIDVPMMDVDNLPDIPQCRVAATVDPAGGIWFEVSEDYARQLRDQVEQQIRMGSSEGLLDVILFLDYPAYRSLTKGLAQLHQSDEAALKQVQVSSEPGDLAITVYVNASQIESSMQKNYAALKVADERQTFGQRFGVSHNGAVMLIQQIEAALEGADDPLDEVDLEDSRFVDGGGRT